MNPYDPCVANMMVKGKQMTVVWHVDDLKLSHADPWEVTKLAEYLSGIYGGLTVHRGKEHVYLGMELGYSTPGSVEVSMVNYLDNVLN